MSNGEKQSWWHTIPGTITAIATLITAIGGMIIILKSIGVIGDQTDTAHLNKTNSTVTDPNTSTKGMEKLETIHLQSKLIIRHPYSYDLDAGIPYRSDTNADVDFIWDHPTSMDFELRPDLGKFSLLGKVNFEDIDLAKLQKLDYSKNSINADLLLKGTVVAVITKEKRFGKLIVEEAGLEPSINVIIYENK